jgi:hypothetical protein
MLVLVVLGSTICRLNKINDHQSMKQGKCFGGNEEKKGKKGEKREKGCGKQRQQTHAIGNGSLLLFIRIRRSGSEGSIESTELRENRKLIPVQGLLDNEAALELSGDDGGHGNGLGGGLNVLLIIKSMSRERRTLDKA